MLPWRAYLLLALLGLGAASDGEKPDEDVLVLTTDTFADVIERQPGPALVKFYIPDCKACLALAPDFKKVATNLKGIAAVAVVDCTNVRSVRTCRAYSAHKFPKILVFKTGNKVNPYTGGAMKNFEEYQGKLTAKGLASAVTEQLDEEHIFQLASNEDHEKFMQKEPKLAKVLLFTDKPSSTVLYKGLSWAYVRRLMFAEVRPADGAQLVEQYGVTEFPTLLVVKPDGSQERYSGILKAPPLRSFLDGYATKEPLPEPGQKRPGSPDGPDSLMEVVLHSLTAANLTRIDGAEDMWLVAFYSAEDEATCSSQLEQLKKLLEEVQGIVKYGYSNIAAAGLDADQLEQYKLDSTALQADGCGLQLVLFPYGKSKSGHLRWSGGLDNAKKLQEWILEQVPDFTHLLSDAVEADAFVSATSSALPSSMLRSAADRQAPVGKVILFSTKHKVPGTYKAIAMHFYGKSRLLFGWTNPDQEGPALPLMQKMNVRKAPAMSILLPLPPKPVGDPEVVDMPGSRSDMALQQYLGPLKFPKMMAWLQAMSALTGMTYKAHAGATEAPSHEDLEVQNQAHLQQACYDKPSLCLLVLLDGRSADVNKHRDTIRKVSESLEGQPLTWVAVDVSRQHSFRRAYGFEADQLPALVALSTKRMRFAQGAAPFGEDTIKQLVTKVLAGSAVTLPLPMLPQLVDGGEEEEEQPLAAVEEEFDLNEILAEEVTAAPASKEELLQQADKELEEAEAKKKKKKKSSKKKKKKTSKKKTKSATKKDEL